MRSIDIVDYEVREIFSMLIFSAVDKKLRALP